MATLSDGHLSQPKTTMNLTSFNDVDAALADVIAYNAADSIDVSVSCMKMQNIFIARW